MVMCASKSQRCYSWVSACDVTPHASCTRHHLRLPQPYDCHCRAPQTGLENVLLWWLTIYHKSKQR
jgi:hypothetical protein